MANTVCSTTGRANDSLMRCSQPAYLSNPLNGRELRRQGKRDKRRAVTQEKKRKGFG